MQNGQKLWEETVALYERATTLFLKNNLLLHFAYADFEEVIILFIKRQFFLHLMVYTRTKSFVLF